MADKLWKAVEREHARRLGGRRIPVNSTEGIECDVSVPVYSVESKERKALPVFLKATMKQAQTHCETNKLAIAILHEKGKSYDDDIVCIRLRDFQDWFVSLEAPNARH